MLTFENKDIHSIIKNNLNASAENIDFQPFNEYYLHYILLTPFSVANTNSSLQQAVKDDVAYLKGHELIPQDVKENISGWIYHVETGKVEKVV